MIKLLFSSLILIFILIGTASAAIIQKDKGFLIQTDFSFISKNKEVSSSSKLILAEKTNNWISLAPLKNGVSLLGRMVKSDKKSIFLEYIVLDNSNKPNSVISTPTIIALYGKKTNIEIEGNQKINISLMAKTTEFERKSEK